MASQEEQQEFAALFRQERTDRADYDQTLVVGRILHGMAGDVKTGTLEPEKLRRAVTVAAICGRLEHSWNGNLPEEAARLALRMTGNDYAAVMSQNFVG